MARRRSVLAGSIPACAGEPHRRVRSCLLLRVDPRVCGGARSPSNRDARP